MSQPTLFDDPDPVPRPDPDVVAQVDGLSVVEGWLPAADQADLVEAIDRAVWSDDLARRVQHYGWRYDYTARSVDSAQRADPFPDWIRPLCLRLADEGRFGRPAEQVIVNEYEPGQGIAPHTDRDCFGPAVATVSLLDTWPMTFNRPGTEEVELWLPPGGLVVLAGAARSAWRHGIPRRKSDALPSGLRRLRRRRVSVTFRTMQP